MSKDYRHHGWVATEYESDFHAYWGMIPLTSIWDLRNYGSHEKAVEAGRRQRMEYFLSPVASKTGNHLYRANKKGTHFRCVDALLRDMERRAESIRISYDDLDGRIRQIVRVAKNRAEKRGIPFDLNADTILARARVGYCEATGAKLDLTNHGSKLQKNAFVPSLDQIEPKAGYTMDNIMVVCQAWNLMKSNFPEGDLRAFIDVLVRKFGQHPIAA